MTGFAVQERPATLLLPALLVINQGSSSLRALAWSGLGTLLASNGASSVVMAEEVPRESSRKSKGSATPKAHSLPIPRSSEDSDGARYIWKVASGMLCLERAFGTAIRHGGCLQCTVVLYCCIQKISEDVCAVQSFVFHSIIRLLYFFEIARHRADDVHQRSRESFSAANLTFVIAPHSSIPARCEYDAWE